MTFFRRWRITIVACFIIVMVDLAAQADSVQRLFDPVDGSVYAARWRYASAPRTPDVLLMGDSRTVIDLSPEIIEQTMLDELGWRPFVLNLGVHGASMEESYLLFSEVVLDETPPRLILFNVSEVALNDAAWAEDEALYLRGLAQPANLTLWREKNGRTAWFETLSGLYRLQRRLRLTVEERWPNYLRNDETYDWGNIRWQGQMDEEGKKEQLTTYNGYLAKFQPDGRQGDYFDKLLALSEEQGIQMIVLVSPVTPKFLEAFSEPKDAALFRAFVSETAAARGVPVADYYQLEELEEDSFFDLHHTNAAGTTAFSKMVAKYILAPSFEK